ncbi:CRISPR-associated protein Cas5 family [Ferroglobus placidus DSM 10642]|uniref:CRISPR-associated protein Cas5 family n=1 Tax=Ferroglobus placidus (strain DSM 10642 / AEDII12DO) TaxID=589924 RepID=D3RZU3_FERPA|nr:type I-A CRISPR-associated protein Cas5a [Ferroglobus placidus]ADC66006.1 CRISPR-associated protein Cas5 family [Ferroglobus placidus DSM 10642]
MMGMKAFIAEVYFPLFSLKKPLAFQVADTNLLPSPSSLRGALAKVLAYFYSDNFSGGDPQEQIEEWMKSIEEIVPYTTSKPEASIIKGSVLLSRLRTLEQRGREDPRDAMRRGITFIPKLKACFIVDENKATNHLGNDALEKIKRAIYAIDRIGDTESLVCVSKVIGPLDIMQLSSVGEVNTITNIDFAGTLDSPVIDNMDFCFAYEATGRKYKKPRYSRTHFLPLTAEKVGKFVIYKPATYRVKVRKGSIYQIDDLKVVIG